jgi:hypothetical protein
MATALILHLRSIERERRAIRGWRGRSVTKERRDMTQTWTIVSILAAAPVAWLLCARLRRDTVAVRLRLDRSSPGAHLMWDIANVGDSPITVTKLVIRTGRSAKDTETIPLGLRPVLEAQEHVFIPTDVDWTLLSARSIAVGDADGREHDVPRHQLTVIQEQLRTFIDRRQSTASARDWLYGATNLAFGVVILGLGFFMLMWVIATG